MSKKQKTSTILPKQFYKPVKEQITKRRRIEEKEKREFEKPYKNLEDELNLIISDKTLMDFLKDKYVYLGSIGTIDGYGYSASARLSLRNSRYTIEYTAPYSTGLGGSEETLVETVTPK